MSTKVTVLSENLSFDPNLKADFGISLWVESNGHSFLMDTGTLGKCLENAAKLSIDLKTAEAIVFPTVTATTPTV